MGALRNLVLPVLVLLVAAVGCGRHARSSDEESRNHCPPDTTPPNLLGYVHPLVGTDDSNAPKPVPGGAGGSTYPGAVVPFGMVQFSPDTPTASPSGYRDKDREIESFSLTHFDGAGCANNEDLPILPFVGDLDESPGGNWTKFKSSYDKASEKASPGYYAVDLSRYHVRAELTATTRTGFARFTFPDSKSARVLVHAGLSATGTRQGTITIGDRRIEGMATAGGFCQTEATFPIYFVIAFDRPFTSVGTWLGKDLKRDATSASGVGAGSYVSFDTRAAPIVQMKVGISFVSLANAKANLDAESADWNFDDVRRRSEKQWNDVLNRIQIWDGPKADLEKFYTALYHVFQNPNVASDVNGEYLGFDKKVHVAEGVRYQNYSGWDIIRSWTHLVAAIAPETPDIVRSMVQDGVEGGLLPFWTHQNVETHVMVGDPGTVNVANAYAMGVRGFDTKAALALMTKSADDPKHTQRWGLADWIERKTAGNAATSLEYAMADFSLGEFAAAIGDEAAAKKYRARSGYWRENFDPKSGFIAPRVGTPSPAANAARIFELGVFGPAAPTNLALGGTATASGSCAWKEGPEKAINGSSADKWCDNTSAEKWLLVDLGAVKSVDKIVVSHAAAGGETSRWNTEAFSLAVSADKAKWTTVATVSDNAANVTTHAFRATNARYVKLAIAKPIHVGKMGEWDCLPFRPEAECGFVEGNAAQYLWLVPHDMAGLFSLIGGRDPALGRLDDLFKELNAGMARPHFYIGNEPEHGTPWVYNFLRAPAKTRAIVRRIIDEEFGLGAGGLPGNDDLGATSAWLVWSYLGLYPVIPGTDVLAVHGPFFRGAELHLANGKTLVIRASDEAAPSIRELRVNGTPTSKNWLRYRDLANGGTLELAIDKATNVWGTNDGDVPPSYGP